MNDMLFIGRSPENHLVIKSDKVSSRHCSVTQLTDNEFLLTDLGSSNGTFINDRRIMQSSFGEADELRLACYPISTKFLLTLFCSGNFKKGIEYEVFKKQELIYEEFIKLQDIYEQYFRQKRMIMKKNSLKSTGIRAGLSFIPVVGSALGILSSAVMGNVQDQLVELEEQFKKNYICPGCFKFLGAEPFENINKRGYCMICKTKWKR